MRLFLIAAGLALTFGSSRAQVSYNIALFGGAGGIGRYDVQNRVFLGKFGSGFYSTDVTRIAYSRDLKVLFAVSSNGVNVVDVWNPLSGHRLGGFSMVGSEVYGVLGISIHRNRYLQVIAPDDAGWWVARWDYNGVNVGRFLVASWQSSAPVTITSGPDGASYVAFRDGTLKKYGEAGELLMTARAPSTASLNSDLGATVFGSNVYIPSNGELLKYDMSVGNSVATRISSPRYEFIDSVTVGSGTDGWASVRMAGQSSVRRLVRLNLQTGIFYNEEHVIEGFRLSNTISYVSAPEPATWVVLGLGGVAILRRRRSTLVPGRLKERDA